MMQSSETNVYDCTLSICTRIVYNTKSNIQKRKKREAEGEKKRISKRT